MGEFYEEVSGIGVSVVGEEIQLDSLMIRDEIVLAPEGAWPLARAIGRAAAYIRNQRNEAMKAAKHAPRFRRQEEALRLRGEGATYAAIGKAIGRVDGRGAISSNRVSQILRAAERRARFYEARDAAVARARASSSDGQGGGE